MTFPKLIIYSLIATAILIIATKKHEEEEYLGDYTCWRENAPNR